MSNMAMFGMPIEKEFTRSPAPVLSLSIVQDKIEKGYLCYG